MVSLSVFGFYELAAAADNMHHGLHILLTKLSPGIWHSVLHILDNRIFKSLDIFNCPGVEKLFSTRVSMLALMLVLLSYYYVLSISATHDTHWCQAPCRASRTRMRFIWLFPGGY